MPSPSCGSKVWTPSIHVQQATQPVLEEWKLLLFVDVKFFVVPNGSTGVLLDVATRTLTDAQQSVHPGTRKLISWLLCERTCHIGLLRNHMRRSRVHQLLNQAWPGGWEMENWSGHPQ